MPSIITQTQDNSSYFGRKESMTENVPNNDFELLEMETETINSLKETDDEKDKYLSEMELDANMYQRKGCIVATRKLVQVTLYGSIAARSVAKVKVGGHLRKKKEHTKSAPQKRGEKPKEKKPMVRCQQSCDLLGFKTQTLSKQSSSCSSYGSMT
jgi:hypothetical protein